VLATKIIALRYRPGDLTVLKKHKHLSNACLAAVVAISLIYSGIAVAGPSTPNEIELPEELDPPLMVIHKLRHPLEGKLLIELTGVYLYGDKFLNTKGVEIEGKYFASEKIALGAGLGIYRSSELGELEKLRSARAAPLTYNPSQALRAMVSFYPIYGKLAFGSSIVHFRLHADVGPQLFGQKIVSFPSSLFIFPDSNNVRWKIGPFTALGGWFALSDLLSANVKISQSWSPPIETSAGEWRRITGISVGLGGRFSL
jgi:hypothetical protein